MASMRHFFSETEKTCLLELIRKHELHSGIIKSPLERQMRWIQVTEEYNCVETNSKRTENQLKKLWENLRTRGKVLIVQEKREMRNNAESCIQDDADDQSSKDAEVNTAKKLTPKQFFSESEKICLQQLMVKHNLHQKGNYGREKKIRWIHLTEEFNSIQTNNTRTTGQLKKCWDNMKTRKKAALSKVKQERIQASEGSCSQDDSTQASQDPQAVFFLEQKPNLFQEELTDTEQSGGDSDSAVKSSTDSDTETSEARSQPPTTRRRTSSQKDKEYMKTEFAIRREKYLTKSEREAEIHKLVIIEKELLVKTAEESYKKAKLEREAAEELLLFNRAKRILAESQLSGSQNYNRRKDEDVNATVNESI